MSDVAILSTSPELVHVRVGERQHAITWDALRDLAGQDDPVARKAYRTLMLHAEESERRRRARACTDHAARTTVTRGYTGPVSRDEDRRAHGNVVHIETCRCGAERRTNSNAGYTEVGEWS